MAGPDPLIRPRNKDDIATRVKRDLTTIGKLLPTPRAQNGEDRNQNVWARDKSQPQNLENALARVPSVADELEHLLPTPRATRGGSNTGTAKLLPTPAAADSTGGRISAEEGGTRESGAKRSITLATAVHHGVDAKLLPTPKAGDADFSLPRTSGRPPEDSTHLATHLATRLHYRLPEQEAVGMDWGEYESAIRAWEAVSGRPAPAPTEPTGKNGARRLSPKFVEWMMNLPEGHVTGVPGITRNTQLKALGNGVVPLQGYVGLTILLNRLTVQP